MNFPGLLVEYLINGCISLLWISKIVSFEVLPPIIDDQKLILIPLAYVLGMFVDYVAWIFTRPIKNSIRQDAARVVQKEMANRGIHFDIEEYELFWDEKIEIEKSYPELNKELTSRSSRDRIARGTMVNLIPISVLYWYSIGIFGVLLLALATLMWYKFEHYNRCFELRAAYSIRTGGS